MPISKEMKNTAAFVLGGMRMTLATWLERARWEHVMPVDDVVFEIARDMKKLAFAFELTELVESDEGITHALRRKYPQRDPENITGKYRLEGHEVVSEPDVLKWAAWFETATLESQVGLTDVGPFRVSTVFVGLEPVRFRSGPLRMFETAVFRDGTRLAVDLLDRYYRTWDEAERGHAQVVDLVDVIGDGFTSEAV